jgi:hypothetical protein
VNSLDLNEKTNIYLNFISYLNREHPYWWFFGWNCLQNNLWYFYKEIGILVFLVLRVWSWKNKPFGLKGLKTQKISPIQSMFC